MKRLHKPRITGDDKGHRIKAIAERHLLYDVAEIQSRAQERGINLVLIGGLAIRAYLGAIRYTSDADFLVKATDLPALKGVLRALGYAGKIARFGESGSIMLTKKHVEERGEGIAYNLEMDISIGGVLDVSRGTSCFTLTDRIFNEARQGAITGFFELARNITVSVSAVSPEDLFVLKTITRVHGKNENGREKDTLDAVLLTMHQDLNPLKIRRIAREQGIEEHIDFQIEKKLIAALENLEALGRQFNVINLGEHAARVRDTFEIILATKYSTRV